MSKSGATLFRTLSAINYIDVRLIRPSSTQLREDLGDLGGLTNSIKRNGLLQPIVVRPKDNYFEVVAGHRRLAACKRLRISKVICLLKELSDKEAYEVGLVENMQRKTLDPVEEARALKDYCDRFGYGSVTELADRIGKSEEYVSHRMLILTLPKDVLRRVSERELSPTLAEELVWVKDPVEQRVLAEAAMSDGLSAKEVRMLAKRTRRGAGSEDAGQEPVYRMNMFRGVGETQDQDARAITEATLILRSALIHLDSLIKRGVSPQLREALMAKRYALHQLLDGLFSLRTERMKSVKALA